jgi:hypothetical protein
MNHAGVKYGVLPWNTGEMGMKRGRERVRESGSGTPRLEDYKHFGGTALQIYKRDWMRRKRAREREQATRDKIIFRLAEALEFLEERGR